MSARGGAEGGGGSTVILGQMHSFAFEDIIFADEIY